MDVLKVFLLLLVLLTPMIFEEELEMFSNSAQDELTALEFIAETNQFLLDFQVHSWVDQLEIVDSFYFGYYDGYKSEEQVDGYTMQVDDNTVKVADNHYRYWSWETKDATKTDQGGISLLEWIADLMDLQNSVAMCSNGCQRRLWSVRCGCFQGDCICADYKEIIDSFYFGYYDGYKSEEQVDGYTMQVDDNTVKVADNHYRYWSWETKDATNTDQGGISLLEWIADLMDLQNSVAMCSNGCQRRLWSVRWGCFQGVCVCDNYKARCRVYLVQNHGWYKTCSTYIGQQKVKQCWRNWSLSVCCRRQFYYSLKQGNILDHNLGVISIAFSSFCLLVYSSTNIIFIRRYATGKMSYRTEDERNRDESQGRNCISSAVLTVPYDSIPSDKINDVTSAQSSAVAENQSMNVNAKLSKSESMYDRVDEKSERSLCKVCLDEDMCVIFLPCRHLATCKRCADMLDHCAVCRSVIGGTFTVPF